MGNITEGKKVKMIFVYERIILLSLLVICPFLAFGVSTLLLLYGIDRKFNIIISAFYWGLYGFLFIPEMNMDITRHYEFFSTIAGLDRFSDFVIWIAVVDRPDYLLYFIYWLVSKIGFNAQFIGFLSASFLYGFLYFIALKWNKYIEVARGVKDNKVFVYLLLPILALTSMYWFSGMRQGNASVLFVFIFLCYLNRSRRKLLLLSLIAGMLHFSLYPLIFLLLITLYANKKVIKFLALLLIISAPFFVHIMHMLSEVLNTWGGIASVWSLKIDAYIFSGDGDNSIFMGPALRWAMGWLTFFCFIPLYIYIETRKVYFTNEFCKLHYFMLLLAAYMLFVLFGSLQIFSRMLDIFKYLFILYTVYILYVFPINRVIKEILNILLLIVFVGGIFSLVIGNEFKTFHSNLLDSNLFTIFFTKITSSMYWTV